ncbi:MAG TPA: HAD-IC family P-type ATPase [Candidatus Limnocylindrales bacterium]|nr:HAD-IC family P-type ATPase [Candidatus Limnocylindrales bacterium]
MSLVLFGVSAVLVALGLAIDAAVTAIPLLLNILVTAGLEARAKHRLEQLRILSSPTATVIRNGLESRVDPGQLVEGDHIVVARGDQISADGELIVGEVEVDESLVTGESEPVVRRPGDPLLSGSVCVSGKATVRVIQTGSASYAGRLTTEARATRTERTPLQLDIERLVYTTAVLVAAVTAIVAVAALGRHPDTGQVARAAAVLVALVPQGLSIMSTVSYAMGALRISRAGALVQRISAVESISRVDALVLDKTGTITSPDLEVTEVRWLNIDIDAGRPLVRAVAGQPGSTDRVGEAIGRWLVAQDGSDEPPATDVAEVVPFSSARRWSGVVLAGPRASAAILGAPEVVLDASRDADLAAEAERWMAGGRHVLVVARAAGTSLHGPDGSPMLPADRKAIALLGFAERLRPDAAATLKALADEGVRIRVVSGDAPQTAAAAAEAAGLHDAVGHQAIGADLDELDDDALADRLDDLTVIGRVQPAMKARIVRVLRSRGRYVGMIGDGVNDIPAIKAANVGVAMESGTSASRAVADIVLLNDRFAVVPLAVAEGRRIVDGMVGAASLLLTRTLYMLVIVLAAALAGVDFPFSPRNNSLLALVTVGLPSLVVLNWARPVRTPASVLRTVLGFAVPAAVAVAVVAFPVYWAYLRETGSVELARSALVTIAVDCGTLLILLLTQPERRGDHRPAILAIAMVALYALISALPLARTFFDLEPLAIADAVVLALVAGVWALGLVALRRMDLPRRWALWRSASGTSTGA